MKELFLLAVVLPAICFGGARYTEKELWFGVPLERLPLAGVTLLARYDPQGQETKSNSLLRLVNPHPVAVGVRNDGTNELDETDVQFIFMHGNMSLQKPDGQVLSRKITIPFSYGQTWSGISPGKETFFLDRPLTKWFPAITNAPDGLYKFWWDVGTNTSERLLLRKTGEDVTPER